MSSKIATILGLDAADQIALENESSKLKSLLEWFTEAIEALKDAPLLKHLGSAGDVAKEWSGTLKVASKLLEKLTKEQSPTTLGWLACTLAYQKSSQDAIVLFGRPASRIPFSQQVVSERLSQLRLEDPSIIKDFSLNSSAGHPFLRAADEALSATLEAAGYDPTERRNLIREVRASFKVSLQDILSGEHKEKFSPFAQWLALDTDERRLDATISQFIDRQRAEFEDQPALGVEPFSIGDVYIESECGILRWKAIRDGIEASDGTLSRRIDPFEEKSAARRDLLKSVTDFIADPSFQECVVIQGAPGSGKSTFTKRLPVHLRKEGLTPIRIPLQHLRVDSNIFDALIDVILRFCGTGLASFNKALLRDKVFSEQVAYGNASISPYVFIFDGWDEISLSADEGFQQRVERLLDSIRQTFINQNRNKVRIILTGRPSQAIGRANFLADETPVMTIRPIRPDQLENYFKTLSSSLKKPAFKGTAIDIWDLGNLSRYEPILKRYTDEFPNTGSLEVLGQPLLAHLAIRVMANFREDLLQLITPPTTLYRHLVDLTCKKGGKAPSEPAGLGSGRIEGKELRALLHGTALAITAHGAESIPMDELEMRLETLGVGRDVFVTSQSNPLANLANLMISFYFKNVQSQSGCEFLHKSFREYLTAEAIVEVLKSYSGIAQTNLPERVQYWQDFDNSDPRWWLSRKLGEILSPQWLSKEIDQHLEELLRWEISRKQTNTPGESPKSAGSCTAPVRQSDWERIRDGLADLWDWWGEGVHLRPQPIQKQKLWIFDASPYVVELAKLAMRRANFSRQRPPRPIRTATIDAHLGLAIFQLNCFLHSFISEANSWNSALATVGAHTLWNTEVTRPRRYQAAVRYNESRFIQFAPSGGSPEYFRNYIDRINGAGVTPNGRTGQLGVAREFPANSMLRGVQLEMTDLRHTTFNGADLTGANLDSARLEQAQIVDAKLAYANLSGASLFQATFWSSNLDHVNLANCNLYLADFRHAKFHTVIGLSQWQLGRSAAGDPGQTPPGLEAPHQWVLLAFPETSETSQVKQAEEKPAKRSRDPE